MAGNFSNSPVGSAVEPCPPQGQVTWIEIAMVGEDGRPVPWIEYLILLPNGERVKGYLDKNGWARIDNIRPAGKCQISFPSLDEEAWVFTESRGPALMRTGSVARA